VFSCHFGTALKGNHLNHHNIIKRGQRNTVLVIFAKLYGDCSDEGNWETDGQTQTQNHNW